MATDAACKGMCPLPDRHGHAQRACATTRLCQGGVAAVAVEEGQVQGREHRRGDDKQDDDPVPHVLGRAPGVDAAWVEEASQQPLVPPPGSEPTAAARDDTPGRRCRSGCSGGEAPSLSCLPAADCSACSAPLPRQPPSRRRSASSCETAVSTRMSLRSCMPASQRRARSGTGGGSYQAALANGGHSRRRHSAVCYSRRRPAPARPGDGRRVSTAPRWPILRSALREAELAPHPRAVFLSHARGSDLVCVELQRAPHGGLPAPSPARG